MFVIYLPAPTKTVPLTLLTAGTPRLVTAIQQPSSQHTTRIVGGHTEVLEQGGGGVPQMVDLDHLEVPTGRKHDSRTHDKICFTCTR